ncbi:actin binding protein [Kickxella alabastrina]|uniref:Actin binding protein n=1 Tax=Kickxella alabastrina TaxID=61397 RepID=A0ACC1IA61_9FUNG|nr:actin binding protein [Kickxella alabastrina]
MSNSVDLSAHASEITSAHQRILNNDPSTSWAIFGFDRGGTALNVESQGSGGLEDLSDEFDAGKVQFAFVRVLDPNTQLPKFVFISWCGQGVPVFRKGMVSSQVGQVQGMLSGSHVTINARSEEDVDAEEIMDKVGRSSGAQYSYHTKPKVAPPVTSVKPAFGAGTAAFRKGATYGAPAVSKGPAWNAPAAAPAPALTPAPALQVPATPYKPPFAASSASKPNVLPKPATAASSLGGTKPLFGGGSGSGASSGRPVSSFFGARSPNTVSTHRSPRPSPPASPIVEPTRSGLSPPPSYRSQQSERHAELEALRRGSRGPSPTGSHGGSRPSTPSRFSSLTSNEPSSLFSQADQTKNELEMLRSRRLLNSSLGASSSGVSSSAADERRAELDAVRRARSGSQTSEKQYQQQQAAPPTHSWKQNQDNDQPRRQQQQQEEERRRHQQQQEEECKRQQQDEQRKRQQQQKEEENRRKQLEEENHRKQLEEENHRKQLEEEDHSKQQQQLQQKSSRGQRARAVYDYEAEAEDELPFKEGEILYNVDQLDPGWWAAETEDGSRQGVFPANFVELIEDDNVNVQPTSAPGLPRKTPAAPALPPMSPAPPPMAPAPPPMAPAPPPMAPAPPPMAPPAPPLPMSFAAPPMAPAPPMVPVLPPRGPPAAPPMAAPMLPPRNSPPAAPPAPPAPPAAPSAPVLPPRGGPVPPPPPPPPPAVQKQKDLGEHYATAVYDYDAAEDGELTFKEGEQITHIEFPSDEWWEGYNSKSEYGLFPANYVELEK